MLKRVSVGACFLFVLLAARGFAGEASTDYAIGDLRKVGTVDFPTSCSPGVQPEFLRGVALLHSFFYDEARRIFTAVAERDPKCAMAHWGVAMTWYHPIWAPPTPDEFKAGLAAVERAAAIGPKTQTERDFIAALATFYGTAPADSTGPAGQSCHGPTDAAGRRKAYTEALEGLYRKYPDNTEAAAFYALALIKSSPTKDAIPVQLKAAGILETLWRNNRNHPGIVHYLIHAYDYPTLARQGLEAADFYAGIAPWVPHALHMPSHIYTRLGMWDKSIHGNLASAAAAKAYAARYYPDAADYNELHALDYLAYAYLQTGQDGKAKQVLDRLAAIDKSYPEVDFAVAYAAGAIPARYALERHAWREAADLPAANERLVAKFPFDAAHVEFARALGSARLGDLTRARKAMTRMLELRDASTDPRFQYFRRQLELQQLAVSGWLARAEGRDDEALALLMYAASEEEALGKHPVSPGAIYPVRELLAELLLDLKRPAEALAAFEQSLLLNPGRFMGIYGAGRAAEAAGRRDAAERYYKELLTLARSADGQRPELAQAHAYLGTGNVKAGLTK